MSKLTVYDKIRTATENESIRATLILVVDEAAETLREYAEQAVAAAEAAEEARDALSNWQEAEPGEDKSEARQDAQNALELLVEALNDLGPSPESVEETV